MKENIRDSSGLLFIPNTLFLFIEGVICIFETNRIICIIWIKLAH
jgi:hypothetical protein